MGIRGTELALGLAAVGTAAAVGYLWQSDRVGSRADGSSASVGAKVVPRAEVPPRATIIDGTSSRLREIPGVDGAIDRALERGQDRWAHVTIDRPDAWRVVDSLRESLPYYEGADGTHNGVYVKVGDRIILVNAIGWDILEEPPT